VLPYPVLAVLPYVKPKEQARLAAARPAPEKDVKEQAWWPNGPPADDEQPGTQVVVFSPRHIGDDEGDAAGGRARKKKKA
jgi:hypothetical protein